MKIITWFSLIFKKLAWSSVMEMKVIIVWFVYHDVSFVGLKLEVANAVKVHVHEDVGEHTLNEIGPDIAAVVILAAQSFTDVPNEVA